MRKIIVTGGCGYIGSHTVVLLLAQGYEVISVDFLEHGQKDVEERIRVLTGKPFQNFRVNLCNLSAVRRVFQQHRDAGGIIHFAAYRLVGESMQRPLRYYGNNLLSLIHVLLMVKEYGIPLFVFSSSSAVYGDVQQLPVTEQAACTHQQSVYGRTKYVGELIIRDALEVTGLKAAVLRYFNPIGAHPSGLLAQYDSGRAQNIVPALVAVATGQLPHFTVHGSDYPTPDGTCIRDYVHVMDIADAHVRAFQYLERLEQRPAWEVINLGSGRGYSVLEVVRAFEQVSGHSIALEMGPRRVGDAVAVYADNARARQLLGWQPMHSLEQMLASAWHQAQAVQR